MKNNFLKKCLGLLSQRFLLSGLLGLCLLIGFGAKTANAAIKIYQPEANTTSNNYGLQLTGLSGVNDQIYFKGMEDYGGSGYGYTDYKLRILCHTADDYVYSDITGFHSTCGGWTNIDTNVLAVPYWSMTFEPKLFEFATTTFNPDYYYAFVPVRNDNNTLSRVIWQGVNSAPIPNSGDYALDGDLNLVYGLYTASFAIGTNVLSELNILTGTPNLEIGTPAALVSTPYTTNFIDFVGTSTNATSFEIWYGGLNQDPGIMLTGLNTQGTYHWDTQYSIPNGEWKILYIARNDNTNEVASTTAVIIVENQTPNAASIYTGSSTATTTDATTALYTTNVNCASGTAAWVEDPNTFYNQYLPAFLQNGSSTSTSSSVIYSAVAGGLYNVIKTPIDLMNNLSCYISTNVAIDKGRGAGSLINQLIATAKQIDNLVNFPFTGLFLFWLVIVVFGFLRKLIPFFH